MQNRFAHVLVDPSLASFLSRCSLLVVDYRLFLFRFLFFFLFPKMQDRFATHLVNAWPGINFE